MEIKKKVKVSKIEKTSYALVPEHIVKEQSKKKKSANKIDYGKQNDNSRGYVVGKGEETSTYEIGDLVQYRTNGGVDIHLNKEEYLIIIRENLILCKIEENNG